MRELVNIGVTPEGKKRAGHDRRRPARIEGILA
jgi:hypothetical protein